MREPVGQLRSRDWVYDAEHYWHKAFESSTAYGVALILAARRTTELNFHFFHETYKACKRGGGGSRTSMEDSDKEAIVIDGSVDGESGAPAQNHESTRSARNELEPACTLDFHCDRAEILRVLDDMLHGESFVAGFGQIINEMRILEGERAEALGNSPAKKAENPRNTNEDEATVAHEETLQPSQSLTVAQASEALKVELFDVLRELHTDITTGGHEDVCVPATLVQAAMQEVASVSNIAMSRLHVAQLHNEPEVWRRAKETEQDLSSVPRAAAGGASRPPTYDLQFHSDLGTHRNEIVPKLCRQIGCRNYLEIGVMNGDCAAAVLMDQWKYSREDEAALQDNGQGRETLTLLKTMHLIDPFENATAAYYDQMAPWSVDYKLQQRRRLKVSQRFAGFREDASFPRLLENKASVEVEPNRPQVKLHFKTSREARRDFEHFLSEKLHHAQEHEGHTLQPLTTSTTQSSSTRHDPLFDLIFIDGDHSYQETLYDLEAWSELVRPGGIVAVHDYSADCVNCEFEVVRAIDDFFGRRRRTRLKVDLNVNSTSSNSKFPSPTPTRSRTVLHASPDVLVWFYV
ncbi:unnamed protein product [Amoebophrya sp. A25]|nr:unnamed protein product [Amoebophrya sp. A25]|eukprot:GSA25T00019438001.1